MSAGGAASPWLILIMNSVVSNATTTKTMMLALASVMCLAMRATLALMKNPLRQALERLSPIAGAEGAEGAPPQRPTPHVYPFFRTLQPLLVN